MFAANRSLVRPLMRAASAAALVALIAGPAMAQTPTALDSALAMQTVGSTDYVASPGAVANRIERRVISDPIEMQYFRPHDARGLNIFEPPKFEGVAYTGNKLTWGASFTQQFQALSHHNDAAARIVNSVNVNQLIEIGSGFNNATANLYLDAQVARGIRVELTSYLSSRHHNEQWVKDGYLMIDGSPIDNAALDNLMKYASLRVGHFEINYGDQHFRRSDNGNTIFNPFVGNLLMDAFTTEIGAEAYLRDRGFLAMAGVTGGEIRGQVARPSDRAPTYLAKLGFDRQVAPALRVRLTGSAYTTKQSVNNTLYSGSRAGSRYYDVLENTLSTESAQAWSGDVQPGFRSKVTAWVVNPFVKIHGLELFGNLEQAKGRTATETTQRTWNQYASEALYRWFGERIYLGSRYNIAKGSFAGMTNDVTVDRVQAAAGWFVTPKVLAKVEYVEQHYRDFPLDDIRHGGRFHGMMFEGAVAF